MLFSEEFCSYFGLCGVEGKTQSLHSLSEKYMWVESVIICFSLSCCLFMKIKWVDIVNGIIIAVVYLVMVDTHFRTFFPFSVVLHLCVQHNKYIMVILGGGLQCLSTLPPKEGLPIIQVYLLCRP